MNNSTPPPDAWTRHDWKTLRDLKGKIPLYSIQHRADDVPVWLISPEEAARILTPEQTAFLMEVRAWIWGKNQDAMILAEFDQMFPEI